MTAPWEKYADGDGPWSQYGNRAPAPPAPKREPVADIPGTPAGYADRVAQIPMGSPGAVAPPAARPAPVPDQERGLFARIRGGLEAARATIASIVPGGVGFGVGMGEGLLRSVASGKFDANAIEQTAVNRAQQATEMLADQPQTPLGKEYLQDIGEFAQRHGASVLAGPLGMTGTGRHTENVRNARQGLRAQVATAEVPPGLPPVAEAPAAGAAQVGSLTKRVVQPNPALLEAVPAAEKAGLTVLPHHVAEGETVRALGTAAGGAVYKQNTKAFTKALIKELDPDEASTRLDTKTFHRVLDKQGKTIGEGMAKTDVPVGGSMRSRLEAISKDAADNADADTGRMTMNRVREILDKAEAGDGVLPGQAAREIDTAIGRQIRGATKNQDLVGRLRALQDTIRDAAEAQMTPEDAKAVQMARRRYAYAMEILPDIDDFGRTGYYEPGQLWKRLTGSEAGRQRIANERGGLTDLAKAGALVADRSGTGHGYVSVGANSVGVGAGGMRAYASPSKLLELGVGAVGGSKAYNRFGPNLVKRLAAEHDAEMARVAAKPEPTPLELAPAGEPMPQAARPDVAAPEAPEWTTTEGAGTAKPGEGIPAIEPEGLYAAAGDDMPPGRIIRGHGETTTRRSMPRAVDAEDPGALPQEVPPRKLRPAEEPKASPGQVAAQVAVQPPALERRGAALVEGVRRPRVPDIPAVPGRPDMPDVMVVGAPGEVAGNLASGVTGAGKKGPIRETTGTPEAMQSPGAVAAREKQGLAPGKPTEPPKGSGGGPAPTDPRLAKIADLRKQHAGSAAVKKVLDAREAEVKKAIKREQDVAELEAAAQATDDPDLRRSLLAEADKARGGKIPTGEVKEGQPELPKPKAEKIPVGKATEGMPELPQERVERLPVGEATEITPEAVEPAPERLPVGEATEMPEPLPVGEVTENPIPTGEAMEFEPLPVGEVTEITPEIVKPAKAPVVPEATNVDNPPTAPAGGGRSGNMEQQKAKRPANGIAAILYETPNFHVRDAGSKGYEVYQAGATASTKVASIGHGKGPGLGLERAKTEADRRQAALPKPTEAPKEPPRAPQEVTQQASVRAEPESGTGGRAPAEAGPGDRVPGAAGGEAKAPEVKPAAKKPAAKKPAAKNPTGKTLSPAEVKAEFQRQIDAVARFDAGGPETITLTAGGSRTKIQNTARRVAEYMKALGTVKGGKTPKPTQPRSALRNDESKAYALNRGLGRPKPRKFGTSQGKRADLTVIKDMIDDLDTQAAVDYAAAQGIDLEAALKGDTQRLGRIQGLKPTPDTP